MLTGAQFLTVSETLDPGEQNGMAMRIVQEHVSKSEVMARGMRHQERDAPMKVSRTLKAAAMGWVTRRAGCGEGREGQKTRARARAMKEENDDEGCRW